MNPEAYRVKRIPHGLIPGDDIMINKNGFVTYGGKVVKIVKRNYNGSPPYDGYVTLTSGRNLVAIEINSTDSAGNHVVTENFTDAMTYKWSVYKGTK